MRKGSHHSKETKEKLRLINLGKHSYKRSQKTIEKNRLASLGKNNAMYGRHHTKETIEKMKIIHLRENLSDKILKNMSESHKGKNNYFYGKHYYNEDNSFYGKHHTKKAKEKMRFAHLGEKAPNWKGGKSFEPYTPEFNRQLKELIRQRDDYKCQKCGMPEIENIEKLSIHHIDYNKENCLPNNLIALCKICNSKVNFNRDYWTEYFKKITSKKLEI